MTQDPEGRWFSFNVTGSDFMILEKKGLPSHLQKLENTEMAVTLDSLVTDMEDLGEAGPCKRKNELFLSSSSSFPTHNIYLIYIYILYISLKA